jgi:hypothetical protein
VKISYTSVSQHSPFSIKGSSPNSQATPSVYRPRELASFLDYHNRRILITTNTSAAYTMTSRSSVNQGPVPSAEPYTLFQSASVFANYAGPRATGALCDYLSRSEMILSKGLDSSPITLALRERFETLQLSKANYSDLAKGFQGANAMTKKSRFGYQVELSSHSSHPYQLTVMYTEPSNPNLGLEYTLFCDAEGEVYKPSARKV